MKQILRGPVQTAPSHRSSLVAVAYCFSFLDPLSPSGSLQLAYTPHEGWEPLFQVHLHFSLHPEGAFHAGFPFCVTPGDTIHEVVCLINLCIALVLS